MRANGGTNLVITAIITAFYSFHAPTALAAQAKPLIKVVAGYGSADGAVTSLWFAKETKLFEKYGLVLDKHRVGPTQCIDSARRDCKIAPAQTA